MPTNPNPITIDNSVLILIDHQPWVAFSVQSIDRTLLVNNVAALAEAAKDLGVPTVLTTVGAGGGPLNDPLFGQISEVFPDEVPIDRVTTNAWADIRPAVEATGRRVLLMAGLWTEVCLAQTALSALKDGYTVYFVSDCSGGVTQRGSRRCQAAHGEGRRQRHQLAGRRSRVDARLHQRRTPGGQPWPRRPRRRCRPLYRVSARQHAGPRR